MYQNELDWLRVAECGKVVCVGPDRSSSVSVGAVFRGELVVRGLAGQSCLPEWASCLTFTGPVWCLLVNGSSVEKHLVSCWSA